MSSIRDRSIKDKAEYVLGFEDFTGGYDSPYSDADRDMLDSAKEVAKAYLELLDKKV